MKIISWNVNSVRARLENIINYVKDSKPDIIFLQEIKTQEITYPKEAFEKIGYDSFVNGQKSYNGVAFVSKIKISNINVKLINDKFKQSRIITGEIELNKKKIKLINVYIPNGNPIESDKYTYKKYWLDLFIKQINKELKKNLNIIISGDFNIIPENLDVYNPRRYENDALFKLEIRKKYRTLINLGFNDVYRHYNKTKQEYTFWDYFAGSWQKNYGLRIDHFLISNTLTENFESININKKPRAGNKPSDHTPVEIIIN